MPHVVTTPTPPFALGPLTVHQVPAAEDNLVWVLVGEGEAAVVDGPDAEGALDLCVRLGVPLTTVLNTHTHGDHVGVNRDLADRKLLAGMRVIGPKGAADRVPGLTEAVDEGDRFTLFGAEVEVWRTEGHLDGHVSFVVRGAPGAVFCGDTLFAGGCGYLFDGPPAKMFRSLLRLGGLPGDTRVCCAHEYTEDNLRFAAMVEPGNRALQTRIQAVAGIRAAGGCAVPSTIAEEQATNPFLRAGSPEIIARLGDLADLQEVDALAVFTATRALKDRRIHRTFVPAPREAP